MKIKKVKYNKHEEPKSLTVEMSVDEAALLDVFTGFIPECQLIDNAGPVWNEARHSIYCAVNHFFNQHDDDGSDAFIPRRFADWYRDRVKVIADD